jgi:hypothetical protein
MDLSGKTLWQIGAGDTDRSFGDICIKFDVMIAGPGNPGPYEETAYAYLGDIRRFHTEAKKGDVVLLRLGTGSVLAVGEIADDSGQWHDAFADVDGWDLQHVRRVRWFPATTNTFPVRTFGGQVKTFATVQVAAVREWVETLDIAEVSRQRKLADLPVKSAILDATKLGTRLFVEGLSSEYLDKLLTTLSSLQRVAEWYSNEDKRPIGRPSEHETICYLVIPFLLSLGWSQQNAAVEWNRVDVALFGGMPSTDGSLSCVVEAKLLGRSVFSPLGQARDYALQQGREGCSRLIVTDGIRC